MAAKIGYFLSSEEFGPRELVEQVRMARASTLVTTEKIVCGDDAEAHLRMLAEYAGAGYDEIYVNQIGPDQRGFFDFYAERILPQFKRATVGAGERSLA